MTRVTIINGHNVLGEVGELTLELARQVCSSEHEIGLIAAEAHDVIPPRWIGAQLFDEIAQLAVLGCVAKLAVVS